MKVGDVRSVGPAVLNRARTGVSPSLPWNALGCVGVFSSGAACPSPLYLEGVGARRRPGSLQTHFGWRPAINSELARTRGIRLSN